MSNRIIKLTLEWRVTCRRESVICEPMAWLNWNNRSLICSMIEASKKSSENPLEITFRSLGPFFFLVILDGVPECEPPFRWHALALIMAVFKSSDPCSELPSLFKQVSLAELKCELTCRSKADCVLNRDPHLSTMHLNGLSPECCRTWRSSQLRFWDLTPYTLHPSQRQT